VAQQGTGAGEQHGGHRPRVSGQSGVAGRVHATPDQPQLAVGQALSDRTLAHALSDQLPPSDDAVLALGKIGDRVVRGTTPQFRTYYVRFCRVRRHVRQRDGPRVTCGLPA
jgi:hypothetical protein